MTQIVKSDGACLSAVLWLVLGAAIAGATCITFYAIGFYQGQTLAMESEVWK